MRSNRCMVAYGCNLVAGWEEGVCVCVCVCVYVCVWWGALCAQYYRLPNITRYWTWYKRKKIMHPTHYSYPVFLDIRCTCMAKYCHGHVRSSIQICAQSRYINSKSWFQPEPITELIFLLSWIAPQNDIEFHQRVECKNQTTFGFWKTRWQRFILMPVTTAIFYKQMLA